MKGKAQNTAPASSVTMAQVARKAGVSRSTVSLAFSERKPIDPGTRDRVRKIARTMNFFPNRAAQSLRAGKTRTLGLFLHDMDDQWSRVIIDEVKAAAEELGYYLSIMFETKTLANRGESYFQGLADGMILNSTVITDDLKRSIEQGFPVAELMETSEYPNMVAGVRFSQEGAYRRLLDYLIQMGHRRFGIIWLGEDEFFKFTLNYLKSNSIAVRSDHILQGARTCEQGQVSFRELHQRGPECTAVLCYNDQVAVGAMAAARELGLRIPGNISIMGNGDTEQGRIWSPSLTTLQYPIREICRETVRRLIDRIDGKPLLPPVWKTAELLIRESVGPAVSK
jgi:DNA-binding LacI/PurR family transcriptional regulator